MRAKRNCASSACVLALATLAACSEVSPELDRAASDGDAADPSSLRVDARYLTHLAFAGSDGRLFYGSFDQTAELGQLTRSYGAWRGDEESWRALLDTQDTLPVPRAGWRLLPDRDMQVRVGDAGQIVSLAFQVEDAAEVRSEVRLRVGEEISTWTGPTGQRESLGMAVFDADGASSLGVLFFRRAARALGIPGTVDPSRTFVLADSLGNAMVIHAGSDQAPSVAHAWLHGVASSWDGLIFERADSVGTSARWRFEIPGTDLRGNIRARPAQIPGAPTVAIDCVLFAGDERFRFSGLSAELPSP